MSLAALRHEIAAQHVSLSLSPAGKLRYEAPSPLSDELLEGLKMHRGELLAELQSASGAGSVYIHLHPVPTVETEDHVIPRHLPEGPNPEIPVEVVNRRHDPAAPLVEKLVNSRHDLPAIPGLPAPLAHLVAAAASDRIKGGAQLPSGMVMDLSAYVLAWAATYLAGDQAQTLARLQEARAVWEQA